MTSWGGDVAAVEELVARLERDPVFVMSLGSKELFHSNLLAWLIERFPAVAEAVTGAPGAVRVAREASHTDLLVTGSGRRPVVVENKVLSLPDEPQLTRIARAFAGQDPDLVLLSLTAPVWESGVWESGTGMWRWMGYEELAARLRPAIPAVRAEDSYAADTVERWLGMVDVLGELAVLVGRPGGAEELLLPRAVTDALGRVRLDPGVQKMRMFHVAALLRARGVETRVDVSNNTALLEWFITGPEDVVFGWQLQGKQWRLAVIVPEGHAGDGRSAAHVAARFAEALRWPSFFSFGAVPGAGEERPLEAGRFLRFNPRFTYRYVPVPRLTVGQAVGLGVSYAEQITGWCLERGGSGVPLRRAGADGGSGAVPAGVDAAT